MPPRRSPEQLKRLQVSSQGPIVKGKTSVSFSVEGNASYDSQTIVATVPAGDVRGQVRRPNDVVNANVRVEQALGAGNAIRAEYQRRTQDRDNLGVGDFELPEHAYSTNAVTDTLRLRNTRVINKRMFSELKFEFVQTANENTSFSTDPTVRVLDAFTRGGAGQSGVRDGREFVVDGSFDFTLRKHALRTGLLFEAGQWDSSQQTNANGTYTFSSLADYEAGLAQQFSRRVGDPLVSYSQYQAGWYLQDDFRLTKNLQVSLGLRQELQTHVDDSWNLAPRAAFTWTVAKTNIRGGWGIFYDWFDSGTYEQTVRVDGTHQIDQVILNPTYPLSFDRAGHGAAAERDPDGRPARPAAGAAGLDRVRQEPHADDRPPRRLHVDAGRRHPALDQRERAGRRRATRSAHRQRHRDQLDRRAGAGSDHRRPRTGGFRAGASSRT